MLYNATETTNLSLCKNNLLQYISTHTNDSRGSKALASVSMCVCVCLSAA